MKELVSKSQSLTVNILNTAWFRYIKFSHPHINSEEVYPTGILHVANKTRQIFGQNPQNFRTKSVELS